MIRSKERKRNRLQGHDYSRNGYYFVTMCVHGMQCVFGDVVDGEMRLNQLGKIAEECLLDLPKHYKNTEILCYAIMLNHIHTVIYIDNPNVIIESDIVGNRYICSLRKRNVELLPEIIGKFKAAVSRKLHALDHDGFSWQKSYYDYIIRSDKEYECISEYIFNNPLNWKNDDYFL